MGFEFQPLLVGAGTLGWMIFGRSACLSASRCAWSAGASGSPDSILAIRLPPAGVFQSFLACSFIGVFQLGQNISAGGALHRPEHIGAVLGGFSIGEVGREKQGVDHQHRRSALR